MNMTTVICVLVAISKFVIGTCDCILDSDVSTGDLSLALEIPHLCGHARAITHASGQGLLECRLDIIVYFSSSA